LADNFLLKLRDFALNLCVIYEGVFSEIVYGRRAELVRVGLVRLNVVPATTTTPAVVVTVGGPRFDIAVARIVAPAAERVVVWGGNGRRLVSKDGTCPFTRLQRSRCVGRGVN
jgi:hypothetical protein